MGYIELPSGAPDTKKAVLSLWFRVPGTSIKAATAEALQSRTDDTLPPPLLGVIPLMTFGPPVVAPRMRVVDGPVVGTFPFQIWDYSGIDASFTLVVDNSEVVGSSLFELDSGTSNMDPSYIGVDCTGDYPALGINLVMPSADKATWTGAGAYWQRKTNTACSGLAGEYFGSVVDCERVEGGPLGDYLITDTFAETNADVAQGRFPETFRLLPQRVAVPDNIPFSGPDDISNHNFGARITPDHWHHLLLSFDFNRKITTAGGFDFRNSVLGCAPIGGYCIGGSGDQTSTIGTVSSSCRMYVALDDKNITGADLSQFRPASGGPNEILTVNGWQNYINFGYDLTDIGCIRAGVNPGARGVASIPKYSYTPSKVPFSKGPMAFPASAAYVDRIRHVEMGEFQLFTDVVMDTGKVLNRRAFITDEGKPANMSAAAKLLGQDPDVKLHGSGKWKKALNTGTAAVSPSDGVTQGDIETYKPNPNLNDDQGDPQ